MSNQEVIKFCDYQLSKEIIETLSLLGYRTPTSIQKQVIPAMLSGEHVIARAPTGTGKTAAFAIPICEKVIWDENLPQALILEPTRELSAQVRDEVFHIGRKKRLKVPALFGGFPIDKQIQTIKQKSHIVVGTPGRIMDHIRRESLKLEKIAYLVIDEADLMLDMGFITEVGQILSLLPEQCRVSLFSATLKAEIMQLVDSYTKNACMILEEAKKEEVESISQRIYEVSDENKFDTFLRVIMNENPESCIIFCGTRDMVNVLFQKLRRKRIFCGMLHGDMEQKERLKTIDAFRRGCFRFLIATDVAARGVDIESITHVINYDFPTGKETYVHRIGRTGRNGKTGIAISLVTQEEKRMLETVEEYTSQSIPIYDDKEVTQGQEKTFWKSQRCKGAIRPEKAEKINKDILRLSIGGGKKSKIRAVDIVGTICNIEGVEASDIGIIDIRESLTYVEILNRKGKLVLESLQTKPIKGKVRRVR